MSERAYLLPDNPDPQEYTCLKVYLPNDPGFFLAFWGSMDYLATWLAWERDAAHNGKLAADSMKIAVQMSKDAFILDGCFQLTEPPYTENTPDGRTPTEATVDDALWGLWDIADRINDVLNGGGSCDDAVSTVAPYARLRTGILNTGVIGTICSAMSAHTEEERNDALAPAAWLDLRNEVICSLPDVPTSGEGEYLSWLDALALGIFAGLTAASSWFFSALTDFAETLAGENEMQFVEGSAGGGGGFGFGGAVCWVHEFDFLVDNGGWTPVTVSDDPWTQPPKGTFTGSGWSTQPTTIIGHDALPTNHCYIKYTLPGGGAQVTEMTMYYSTGGTANDAFDGGWRMRAWDDIGGNVERTISVWPIPAGANQETLAITNAITTELWAGLTFCTSDVGTSYITKVVIQGTGDDPFA